MLVDVKGKTAIGKAVAVATASAGGEKEVAIGIKVLPGSAVGDEVAFGNRRRMAASIWIKP